MTFTHRKNWLFANDHWEEIGTNFEEYIALAMAISDEFLIMVKSLITYEETRKRENEREKRRYKELERNENDFFFIN